VGTWAKQANATDRKICHVEEFCRVTRVLPSHRQQILKPARGTPKEIMLQFLGAWLLETDNLATCKIDPGHHVPNGAIFSCSVHALEDQQQRMTVRSKVKLLQ